MLPGAISLWRYLSCQKPHIRNGVMALPGRAAVVENINRAMRMHDGDSGNTAVVDILGKFIFAVLHMHDELGLSRRHDTERPALNTWSVRGQRLGV